MKVSNYIYCLILGSSSNGIIIIIPGILILNQHFDHRTDTVRLVITHHTSMLTKIYKTKSPIGNILIDVCSDEVN